MRSHLGLSFRFLNPGFHGRRDAGAPEWPPSPLRVFQALVAAAAARETRAMLAPTAQSALRWLETQARPLVLAPAIADRRGALGYCLSIPNNAMDIVGRAWSRGADSKSGDANPATHRTMKTVRPTLLAGGNAVHYLWPLPEPVPEATRRNVDVLCGVARNVVVLGWGIDTVVGHGAILSDEEVEALVGERWLPGTESLEEGLRVPGAGTLDDLIHRHERFLTRLGPDGVFNPPPPLTAYATVTYRRATDPPHRPVASFSLLQLEATSFRAFDTARSALTVAGMTRHAASLAAAQAGWTESRINAFVLGHGESKTGAGHIAVGSRRFAYMPLPSIEARGRGKTHVVGSVRRVLLSCFGEGCEEEIAWARRRLSGEELVDEHQKKPVALLSLLPATDKVVRHYTERATSWSTVTPVVLPGYDDRAGYRQRLRRGPSAEEQRRLLARLDRRVEQLLRKAITQAGFPPVLAAHAELEWRSIGFWPGTDLASRYGVPDHLKHLPRYHVRLQWRDVEQRPVEIPGPVCLGAGRFYGLGLFAAF